MHFSFCNVILVDAIASQFPVKRCTLANESVNVHSFCFCFFSSFFLFSNHVSLQCWEIPSVGIEQGRVGLHTFRELLATTPFSQICCKRKTKSFRMDLYSGLLTLKVLISLWVRNRAHECHSTITVASENNCFLPLLLLHSIFENDS